MARRGAEKKKSHGDDSDVEIVLGPAKTKLSTPVPCWSRIDCSQNHVFALFQFLVHRNMMPTNISEPLRLLI